MKKGEHNGKRTPRGFREYAVIVDAERQEITVRESSLATERRVRLFVKGPNGEIARLGLPWRPWTGGDTGTELSVPSAHLNVRDAKRLIQALQRFVDGEE